MGRPSWLLVLALLGASLSGAGLVACGGEQAHSPTSARALPPSASRSSGAPPQNDDYISTYGHPASPALRRSLAGLVRRYYAAALAGDGALACSLLNPTLAKSLPEDYGQTAGVREPREATCATVLPRLFAHVPGQQPAELASTRVTGARLRGARGFVQLSSRSMPTGEISVERIGGAWRLGAPIGRACRHCAAR